MEPHTRTLSTTATTLTEPVGATPPTTSPAAEPPSRGAWKVAGALGIAHLVIVFGGLAVQTPVLFEEGRAGVERYATADLTRTVAGGYVELLGFLLLIPVMVFVARSIGRTPTGRWAAVTALVAGGGYVAMTFSPGLAAGATAMHAVDNGVGLDAAWMMNNLRVITYVMSLALLGAHAIGVGIAARTDHFSPRLVGIGGVLTGALLLAAPLLLPAGLHDVPMLVWSVWWLALSVQLVRRDGR